MNNKNIITLALVALGILMLTKKKEETTETTGDQIFPGDNSNQKTEPQNTGVATPSNF
jgi:hypothetical protein